MRELLLWFVSFKRVLNYLNWKEVFTSSVTMIIAQQIMDLTDNIMESFIEPFINKDTNKDGIKDFQEMKDRQTELYGVKFKTGNFLIKLLKSILLLVILHFVCYFLCEIVKI